MVRSRCATTNEPPRRQGRCFARREDGMTEASPTVAPRLRSLDAFRGLTVLGMLLVNNPGTWAEIYAPMRHAEWHGWTPTDLIFPYFLFIVGVALVFAIERQRSQGA